MSQPHSDAPRKDQTKKFNGDAIKRAPKRPRNSKRPTSKTIGFGMQSPDKKEKEIPRMGEKELWQALDGAISKATQEDTDSSPRKTKPTHSKVTSPAAKPSTKPAAKPTGGGHKTVLGMPALSPVKQSQPQPIPVETPKKPTPNTAPKEAFMKTMAMGQSPALKPTGQLSKPEEEPQLGESSTETLSAEELLELDEDNTGSAELMTEFDTTDSTPPQKRSSNVEPELLAEPLGDEIELTTLPPEMVEETSQPAIASPSAAAKTEHLAAANLQETKDAAKQDPDTEYEVSAEPDDNNIALETFESDPTPKVEVAGDIDVAEKSIVADDLDGEVPFLPENQHGKKRTLVIGGIAALVISALSAAALFLFVLPSSPDPDDTQASQRDPANAPATPVAPAEVEAAGVIPTPPPPAPPELPADAPSASGDMPKSPAEIAPKNANAESSNTPTKTANEAISKPATTENMKSDQTQTLKTAPKVSPASPRPAAMKEKSKPISSKSQAAAPATPPADGDSVTITINGTPTGATIRVNGQIVERTFTVPKSEKCIKVVVTREGFEKEVKRVIPLRDKHIRVKMKKL